MIERDCGVVVEESFVLKRVDENFFEEPQRKCGVGEPTVYWESAG
jgi:hypothetical protein